MVFTLNTTFTKTVKVAILIKGHVGGVEQVAKEFSIYTNHPKINEMKKKLSEKFASYNHAGPVDVAIFLDFVDEEEIDMKRRDAFEQIQALLTMI